MVLQTDTTIVRCFVLVVLVVGMITVGSASTIEHEREVVQLGSPVEVEVTIEYADFTSDQVSRLVPPSHDPRNVKGQDKFGSIPCSSEGNELLCEPSVEEGNYTVTINYETPMPEQRVTTPYQQYNHSKRILTTTEQYSLRVILPEGYGTANQDGLEPYLPTNGEDGSLEGRAFYVEWTDTNVSLTDRMDYTVRYQELAVFESFPVSYAIILALLAIIGIGGGLWLYSSRSTDTDEDTIASVLPVLKEDEQEVLRYMIEQEGECEQKALVEDLTYSKAKVSRLLKDLEERNLIEKIKEGRKNRVELAKEIGDVDL